MATPRIIKKYPNRRLYDTETSTYITLAEVKDLVLEYREFQVQDAKSGDDLTRAILLQIILEEESGGVPMFSTDMLANIIRYYGHSMQGLMGSYLERSIHAFHEAQKRFQEQAQVLIPKVPTDAFANMMTGAPQIPQVMGGYLEKGAKAVIDMQDELRNQAFKIFSGFPYAQDASGAPAAPQAAPEPAKAAAKPARAPRKPRAKK
jgi:polyhydroxyalkanoate synthesis repressor PhaR